MSQPSTIAVTTPPRPGHELLRRVLTAVVLLPPVGWVLWSGGWAMAALCAAGSALATREFLRLAPGQARVARVVALLAAAALPLLPLLFAHHAAESALLLLALASFIAWVEQVVRQDVAAGATTAAFVAQSLLFCALGPWALVSIRSRDDGAAWVLAIVAATFANDAFAYGGGKLLGRHRIAKTVSPGKTWEGAAVGALGSLAAATGAALLWPGTFTLLRCAVLVVSCATLGPLGDFAKSLLKRSRGVKDAGQLLPGHGGMLDRIDALVVNAVALWAFLTWSA